MGNKYYKLKIENLLVIDKIVTIHYFEFSKNFRSKGEAHDFWELVYADKEDITVTENGRTFTLKEGEITFHKPNAFHVLAANGQSAPNVFIISFTCKSQTMRFFENKALNLDKSLLKFIYTIVDESKKTFDLPYSDPELKKMELLKSPLLGGEQTIKNYLEILLINIMRREAQKENPEIVFLPSEQLKGYLSRSIIKIMRERVSEKLTVNDFCDALNYNKSYIHQQFRKETGRTLMAYFMGLKIERAKQLLREGNMNVTQISAYLSFDTPNYFSKTFKKATGFTPLQYKKMATELS